MKTSDFEYELPPELIAQEPAAERDKCRLLVMDRVTGELEDRIFCDIVDYVNPGDLLVVNETRVLPARLLGKKRETPAQVAEAARMLVDKGIEKVVVEHGLRVVLHVIGRFAQEGGGQQHDAPHDAQ